MMLIKPDPNTTNSSAAVPVCGNCRVEERLLLLHHVRHRSVFLRLCTTCVLRLHSHNFCPTCFQVYPPPPPSNDGVRNCSKCYSVTHTHCADSAGGGGGPTFPPASYICPLCLHPDKPVFKLKSAKEANVDIGAGDDCTVMMDRDSAKKFMAAAKIAAASMNSAAAAAKGEAERRAKEAAVAKRRAKESLEHVARLVVKEKLQKKDDVLAPPGNPTDPTPGGIGVKMEREYNNNKSLTVAVDEKIDNGADNSNQVLEALNAVELRENEEIGNGENVGDLDEERNNDSGSDQLNFVDIESGDLNIEEEKLEDVKNEIEYTGKDNGVESNGNDAAL
ncbi:hypothetical protein ACP275_14G085700 [Erythranthe tilingii]